MLGTQCFFHIFGERICVCMLFLIGEEIFILSKTYYLLHLRVYTCNVLVKR